MNKVVNGLQAGFDTSEIIQSIRYSVLTFEKKIRAENIQRLKKWKPQAATEKSKSHPTRKRPSSIVPSKKVQTQIEQEVKKLKTLSVRDSPTRKDIKTKLDKFVNTFCKSK